MPSPRVALVAATAFAPTVWGTTYIVTTELLPPDRPLFTALMRALPAGLLLVAVTHTLPRGSWWWRAPVLGALNIGLFFPLLFLSAYRLPGGVAGVLGSIQPLIVAGLTRAVLRETVPVHRVVAGITATAGISLVVLRANAALDATGVAAGLLAAAGMATGVVLTRSWGKPPGTSDLALTGWQLTAGGLMIAPVAFALEGPPPPLDGAAAYGYAWLGLIGTAIAYSLWFRGISRLAPLQVSLLGTLSPLTAALAGWIVLGQSLSPFQFAGFALALAATVAGQLPAPGRTGPSLPKDTHPPLTRSGRGRDTPDAP
ncbi:EamA family transporter [Streptosporangium sp. NPDC051023]|uniref:EamA family transporter n=1 Tax=Streptosporangium sp. NPDC051023 TaxID=3155410 RepID=UPI00344B2B82